MTRLNIPHLELLILATCAVFGALWYKSPPPATTDSRSPESQSPARPSPPTSHPFFVPPCLRASVPSLLPLAITSTTTNNFLTLTLLFLKIGSTLFGSGYLLVSYLHSSFVEQHPWLTPQQVTDAIAVGQITPGPLLTTATFVGYHLGHQWTGHAGALLGAFLATTAIFLPSFLFVALLGKLWPFINRSPFARGAFNGMNAAVVALILVAALHLARDSITTLPTATLSALTLAALLIWNLNSTWLILAAAAVGYLLFRFKLI